MSMVLVYACKAIILEILDSDNMFLQCFSKYTLLQSWFLFRVLNNCIEC